MQVKDFIITPVLLIVIYFAAYLLKPFFTNKLTQEYFIPGLTVKIIGALAVGFIYQFYYPSGGDTFNFYINGQNIWQAFLDSPWKGFKLIFLANGEHFPDTFEYSTKMFWYQDPASYMVIRIVGFFGILTFYSYPAIAVLFATFSFLGVWKFYYALCKLYPPLRKKLAIAVLFIPTVFFWGSGIFKDTITFGFLGLLTGSIINLFIFKKELWWNLLGIVISVMIISQIKVYILICFFPAAILLFAGLNLKKIKPIPLRTIATPVIIMITLVLSYYSISIAAEQNQKYAIDQIATTALITSHDIAFQTGRGAGSTYVLGELDGTLSSMVRLAPKAINVSLFRPYLWEVKNPLMLLSALEALFFVYITAKVLFNKRLYKIPRFVFKPFVLFCLTFSLTMAFATGVSTFNFGSLSRYKIILIPFYLAALFILEYYLQKSKNWRKGKVRM